MYESTKSEAEEAAKKSSDEKVGAVEDGQATAATSLEDEDDEHEPGFDEEAVEDEAVKVKQEEPESPAPQDADDQREADEQGDHEAEEAENEAEG